MCVSFTLHDPSVKCPFGDWWDDHWVRYLSLFLRYQFMYVCNERSEEEGNVCVCMCVKDGTHRWQETERIDIDL